MGSPLVCSQVLASASLALNWLQKPLIIAAYKSYENWKKFIPFSLKSKLDGSQLRLLNMKELNSLTFIVVEEVADLNSCGCHSVWKLF